MNHLNKITMEEQEHLDQQKSQLIDDLLATSTVMEELWLRNIRFFYEYKKILKRKLKN